MAKTKLKMVVFTLVSVMVLTLALPATAFAQVDEVPTIRVSGSGTITVAPDIAMFTLGVSSTSDSAQDGLRQNTVLMDRVIAAVKELGVEESDIATNQFSIQQMWHPVFDRFHMDMVGGENQYAVTNSITITVRDLDAVGDIVAAGVGAGANMSGNIWFNLEDSGELYYEALALAIEDAARKSRIMATALNTSITGVVTVMETSGWSSPGLSRGTHGFALDSSLWMTRQASEWGPPIHGRYVEVTARVEVVYSIAR